MRRIKTRSLYAPSRRLPLSARVADHFRVAKDGPCFQQHDVFGPAATTSDDEVQLLPDGAPKQAHLLVGSSSSVEPSFAASLRASRRGSLPRVAARAERSAHKYRSLSWIRLNPATADGWENRGQLSIQFPTHRWDTACWAHGTANDDGSDATVSHTSTGSSLLCLMKAHSALRNDNVSLVGPCHRTLHVRRLHPPGVHWLVAAGLHERARSVSWRVVCAYGDREAKCPNLRSLLSASFVGALFSSSASEDATTPSLHPFSEQHPDVIHVNVVLCALHFSIEGADRWPPPLPHQQCTRQDLTQMFTDVIFMA